MNVGELIEKLEGFDKDMPVGVFVEGWRDWAEYVGIEDEDGTPYVEIW